MVSPLVAIFDELLESQLLPESIENQGGADAEGALNLRGARAVGIDDVDRRGELQKRSCQIVEFA